MGGGGGTKVNFPPAPGPSPVEQQLSALQLEYLKAVFPSAEELDLQRQVNQGLMRALAQVPKPEDVTKREQQQVEYLTGILNEDIDKRRTRIMEQANRYGFNPALAVGELERAGVTGRQAIVSGDALSRATNLLSYNQGALQDYFRNLGLGGEVATAPYFRAIAPASALGMQQSQRALQSWSAMNNIASVQAQLAAQSRGGMMGSLAGLGSMGGAIMSGIGMSSRRFKEEIEPLTKKEEEAALKDILRARLVKFQYKGDTERRVGFIAEDAPEAFVTPNRMFMDMPKSIGTLMAGVKSQQRELQGLRHALAGGRINANT